MRTRKSWIAGVLLLTWVIVAVAFPLASCTKYTLAEQRVLTEKSYMGFRIEVQCLDDLIRGSSLIVKGEVEQVNPPASIILNQNHPLQEKAGSIKTVVTQSLFKVREVISGDDVGDSLTIQQIGDFDSGETKLEKGKSYILILEKREDYYRPYDYENGVYTITRGRSESLGNNQELCQYDGKDSAIIMKDIRAGVNKIANEKK